MTPTAEKHIRAAAYRLCDEQDTLHDEATVLWKTLGQMRRRAVESGDDRLHAAADVLGEFATEASQISIRYGDAGLAFFEALRGGIRGGGS